MVDYEGHMSIKPRLCLSLIILKKSKLYVSVRLGLDLAGVAYFDLRSVYTFLREPTAFLVLLNGERRKTHLETVKLLRNVCVGLPL